METEWEGSSTPNTKKASERNENDLPWSWKVRFIFCPKTEAEPARFYLWGEQQDVNQAKNLTRFKSIFR